MLGKWRTSQRRSCAPRQVVLTARNVPHLCLGSVRRGSQPAAVAEAPAPTLGAPFTPRSPRLASVPAKDPFTLTRSSAAAQPPPECAVDLPHCDRLRVDQLQQCSTTRTFCSARVMLQQCSTTTFCSARVMACRTGLAVLLLLCNALPLCATCPTPGALAIKKGEPLLLIQYQATPK